MTTFANVEGSSRATPSLESQVIDVAEYETIIVDPITSVLLNQLDSDFVAGNIKSGVDLFGLMGTMESGSNNFASGIFTPIDTTASQIEITHGLGATPELVFIAAASIANRCYNNQKPYGQTFFYYVKVGTEGIQYGARYRMADTSSESFNSSKNITGTFGTGLNYYIAADSEKIYWPNRNSSYGFGQTSMPFVWVAMKEMPV